MEIVYEIFVGAPYRAFTEPNIGGIVVYLITVFLIFSVICYTLIACGLPKLLRQIYRDGVMMPRWYFALEGAMSRAILLMQKEVQEDSPVRIIEVQPEIVDETLAIRLLVSAAQLAETVLGKQYVRFDPEQGVLELWKSNIRGTPPNSLAEPNLRIYRVESLVYIGKAPHGIINEKKYEAARDACRRVIEGLKSHPR